MRLFCNLISGYDVFTFYAMPKHPSCRHRYLTVINNRIASIDDCGRDAISCAAMS